MSPEVYECGLRSVHRLVCWGVRDFNAKYILDECITYDLDDQGIVYTEYDISELTRGLRSLWMGCWEWKGEREVEGSEATFDEWVARL